MSLNPAFIASPSVSNGLILRTPTPFDLPPLYTLAEDNKAKFLDDYHTFDLEYAKELLADPNTLIIDDIGYAAGVFWFDETLEDLHTSIHLLIRPEYWRRLLTQDLSNEALKHAFQVMGVNRVYAFPMSTQKSAIRLLKRYGFYSHLPWRSHTKQGGKKVDTIFMELKRSKWEKNNGLR